MQIIDTFSGIGGFSLAGRWMGWETVQFCEIDLWCQKVLSKHWPGVPIHDDIKTLTREKILQNGRWNPEGPTIVVGGVPCQPASHAGKRKGQDDDRWLWPEYFRVIREVQPTFIVAENVAGLISLDDGKALDGILSGLEGEGYHVESFVIPACGVGAWHRRDRIWIIGYKRTRPNSPRTHANQPGPHREEVYQYGEAEFRYEQECELGQMGENVSDTRLFGSQKHEEQTAGIEQCGQDVSDTTEQGLQNRRGPQMGQPGEKQESERQGGEYGGSNGQSQSDLGLLASRLPAGLAGYWDREPEGVPRVATGVKDRVNKLKALGNAVVPQVVYEIFKAIDYVGR